MNPPEPLRNYGTACALRGDPSRPKQNFATAECPHDRSSTLHAIADSVRDCRIPRQPAARARPRVLPLARDEQLVNSSSDEDSATPNFRAHVIRRCGAVTSPCLRTRDLMTVSRRCHISRPTLQNTGGRLRSKTARRQGDRDAHEHPRTNVGGLKIRTVWVRVPVGAPYQCSSGHYLQAWPPVGRWWGPQRGRSSPSVDVESVRDDAQFVGV